MLSIVSILVLMMLFYSPEIDGYQTSSVSNTRQHNNYYAIQRPSSKNVVEQRTEPIQRRTILERTLLSIFAGGTILTASTTMNIEPANAGVTCIQGEGDGCAELAENNEYIKMLQQRSIQNKERNEKVR